MEFYRKMKKNHAAAFTIVDTVTIILFLLILGIFILGFSDNTHITILVTDILRNWNEGPIEEIKKRKGRCPIGWETILTSKYPGTNKGCYCRLIREDGYIPDFTTSSDKDESRRLKSNTTYRIPDKQIEIELNLKEEIYIKDKCEKVPNYQCSEIDQSKPVKLKLYKENGYCARRSPYNYFELYKTLGVAECKKGFKDCGVIDNFGNIMCVLNNVTCPYYDMRWVDKKVKKKQLIF